MVTHKPAVFVPLAKLVAVVVVVPFGGWKVCEWLAAGYSVAALIAAVAVLGFIGCMYPGDENAN